MKVRFKKTRWGVLYFMFLRDLEFFRHLHKHRRWMVPLDNRPMCILCGTDFWSRISFKRTFRKAPKCLK